MKGSRALGFLPGLLYGAAVLTAGFVIAQPRPPGQAAEELRRLQRPTELDRRVERGLQFLKENQRPDGSFGTNVSFRTALTSLAVMAFLANGHVPGETEYGQVVRKGLDFLLTGRRQDKEGYFGRDHTGRGPTSRMYGHGITTLLLAEVLGMGASKTQEAKVLVACQRAIDLILKAQAVRKVKGHEGGWRYSPTHPSSDLSVTVWQVMALRAAKNSGMKVPDRAIEEALRFIKNCFKEKQGGFAYQPNHQPIPSTVAAGLFSLQVCGIYSGRHVRASADWLMKRPPRWEDRWFYYAVYYYSQAMHQLGERYDRRSRGVVHRLLFAKQAADGSWPPAPNSKQEETAGVIYRTAMALLALSVEYRLLPIYQR